MDRIIYALKCPFTDRIHYIGKSTSGIVRPNQHLKESHSNKIKEWVEDLKVTGQKPFIEILEYVSLKEDIDLRERYHIGYHLNKGALLLNSNLINPIVLNSKMDEFINSSELKDTKEIAETLKIKRKQAGLTQEDFAERTGIALTVLRKIEQGKTNINLSGLIEALSMFGLKLTIKKFKKDKN